MKVGLVCPYSLAAPGGVQTQVCGLAGWLKSQGHAVSVLAPEASRSMLPAHFDLSRSELADAGPTHGFAFNGSVAPVALSMRAVAVAKRWLKQPFDVVHIHEPLVPLVGTAALRAQAPLVATFHASLVGESLATPWWRAHIRSLNTVDARLAVSALAAGSVRSLVGLDCDIIPNGIDVPLTLARQVGQWRSGTHPIGVFVGRIDEPRKGFSVALDAVPQIREVYPGFELLVVGPGTQRPSPGVRYLGALESTERDKVLASADVLIAPNTGQESFGLVLAEALAQGLRVVASDLCAFRDVLYPPVGGDGRDSGNRTEGHAIGAEGRAGAEDSREHNGDGRDRGHAIGAEARAGGEGSKNGHRELAPDEGAELAGCRLFAPGDTSALVDALCQVLEAPSHTVAFNAHAMAQRYAWSTVGPQVLSVYQRITS